MESYVFDASSVHTHPHMHIFMQANTQVHTTHKHAHTHMKYRLIYEAHVHLAGDFVWFGLLIGKCSDVA